MSRCCWARIAILRIGVADSGRCEWYGIPQGRYGERHGLTNGTDEGEVWGNELFGSSQSRIGIDLDWLNDRMWPI
jgi:hypothetical protein